MGHLFFFIGQVSMEAEADVEDIITREDGVVEAVGLGSAACCEFHRERVLSDTFWLAQRRDTVQGKDKCQIPGLERSIVLRFTLPLLVPFLPFRVKFCSHMKSYELSSHHRFSISIHFS